MNRLNTTLLFVLALTVYPVSAADYPLAINQGRVIDPESGLDAIRDNATYSDRYQEATSITYVIVNGQATISNGRQVEGVYPGKRILAR